jgi:hypothetical protein
MLPWFCSRTSTHGHHVATSAPDAAATVRRIDSIEKPRNSSRFSALEVQVTLHRARFGGATFQNEKRFV